MEKRTKESKKRLNSLILLIAFTAILLIASTYAWFTTQKNVSINNLRGVVEVAEGLEISLNGKTWGTKIDLDNLSIQDSSKNENPGYEGPYVGNNNIDPSELLPVSTIGELNDNKLALLRGTLEGVKFSDMVLCNESKYGGTIQENGSKYGVPTTADTDDDIAINAMDYPSFIAFDVFLRNTTRDRSKETEPLQLNGPSSLGVISDGATGYEEGNQFNRSLTNRRYHIDENAGLQNTARVGFVTYNEKVDVTADASTVVSTLGTGSTTANQVSIWEPNADNHIDYIVQSNNKITTTAKNGGIGSGNLFKDNTVFFTYGIKKAAADKTYTAPTFKTEGEDEVDTAGKVEEGAVSIDDIYKWDGTGNTNLAQQNTVQTPKTGVAEGDVYDLTTVAFDATAGADPDGDTNKLTIPANYISKVRIYVWLEGQDPDCINYASFGGGIEVNIGLTKGVTTAKKLAERIKPEDKTPKGP